MADFRKRYQNGVNLGGWLSQYPAFDYDHFDGFVDESDVGRIASWGMDHVRLPVDYPVLLGDAGTDGYNERGFSYVDDCIEWCRERGLDVVIDLHEAPGYSFSDPENDRLFREPDLRDRFVDLWRELARRYESTGDGVAFELLNEVVDPPDDRWNRLVHRTVEAIREVDADRDVLVGSEQYNAVDELDGIDPLRGDDDVAYTFHFYEPLLLTHQHAGWVEAAETYDTDVQYPGTFPGLEAFLDDHPEYGEPFGEFVGETIDREWIEAALRPAVEFRRQTGADLYCGEYGVIDAAPEATRIEWCRDVVDVLSDLDIGRGYWSYKEMDFGLVDGNGDVVSEELLDVVSQP